jgi:hemerythrin superfamily protein
MQLTTSPVQIRGMNSIYLQAPHIKKADEKTFLNYMEQWYVLMHAHHSSEEAEIFPIIEDVAGEKGIMDANVQQHHIFEPGVAKLHNYIQDCLADKVAFDGAKIQANIDEFGKVLTQHLTDEIATLLTLRKYGDKMHNIMARFAHVGQQQMQEVGMLKGGIWLLVTHDIGYEGGIHAAFPPAPWFVLWGLRGVGFWAHSDWWKFAPSDRVGNLQHLYACPKA